LGIDYPKIERLFFMLDLNYEMQGVWKMFRSPAVSVIVSHRNPDGDAIGSSLALYHILKKMGHTVHVVFPSEYPVVFSRFVGDASVKIYDIHTEDVRSVIKQAENIFTLDFNSLDRVDKVGEIIGLNERATIAMIDHHLDPEPYAKWMVSDTQVSSTCELLYDVLVAGQFKDYIDPHIAELLLLGVLTDTGCFSYSVSPALFRKAAFLMDHGVHYKELVDEIFNAWDEKYAHLLGHSLANRLEFVHEAQAAIIYLTKDDFLKFNIQRGDTEGIVNYLLKIRTVNIAILITEQPTILKFSFRSKGDYSVADYARLHFKGGGHKNASGGSMYGTMDSARQKVKETLMSFFNGLNA
jgi:bifunctional oligoribonuclease and PAP phosphatase NrnA